MFESFKITVFHISGIKSCNNMQKLILIYFDDKFYIKNLPYEKTILEFFLQEITDFNLLEEAEIKERFSYINAFVGYSVFGIIGSFLGILLPNIKSINHKYLYIKTQSDELIFEVKENDIYFFEQFCQ